LRPAVHRLTVADIEAHSARYAELAKTDAAAAERVRLPMFGDVPDDVIAFLDPDDAERLNKAVERQLPLSLRRAIESPSDSGASSPSS
jgi:hypothetical protein